MLGVFGIIVLYMVVDLKVLVSSVFGENLIWRKFFLELAKVNCFLAKDLAKY